jgi:modification methylase
LGVASENGLLRLGETLWFAKDEAVAATVRADGKITSGSLTGSIHSVAKGLLNGAPINGWDVWLFSQNGEKKAINCLRELLRTSPGSLSDKLSVE